MLFYLIIYIVSALFSVIASYYFKKKNKFAGVIFSIIAILIPSVVAGLRTDEIGTDTSKYVSNTFNAALNGSNYSEAFDNMSNASNVEYLYKLINYGVSRFTDNINILYFLISLITTTLIYLSCYNNKSEKGNYSLAYFSFLVLFFNRSLNLCRQSIAIAIILYSSKYIFKKNLKKYLIGCLIASLFHSISVFFISLYWVVKYINGRAKKTKKISVFLIALVFVSQYQNILLFMINNLGILDKRYLFYVIDYANRGTNILFIELVFMFILVLTIFAFRKRIKDERIKTYCTFFILSLIIYLIGIYANYAFRLSYYLYAFVIFILQSIKDSYNIKNNRIFISSIICITICLYSYLYYDVNKFDQTVPYKTIMSERG